MARLAAQALHRVRSRTGRSPVDTTPVPYVSRTALSLSTLSGSGATQDMAAYGANGTLFAIVNRISTATGGIAWSMHRATDESELSDHNEMPELVTRHPALDLIRRPNAFMTWTDVVESTVQYIDLTGTAYWVVARNSRSAMPLELWPIRPDRIEPVPSATDFLAGWIYRGPGGEVIPLGLDEVIQLKMPNPLDPYVGLGPVQTILTDLDASRFSAEWNRNFFKNSALPGGIIEMDHRMGDEEFEELRDRWAEQHKGVGNAHRVAILEQGRWVERKFSMEDMQFTQLREVSREIIREAFGFPKPLLGSVDDVNRANAEAGEVVFARWLLIPRLSRIRSALNHRLLPMFGVSGQGVLFSYCNPVPEDQEAERAERDSKANAAKIYITDIGCEPAGVFEMLGLPDLAMAPKPEPPAPVITPVPPTGVPEQPVPDDTPVPSLAAIRRRYPVPPVPVGAMLNGSVSHRHHTHEPAVAVLDRATRSRLLNADDLPGGVDLSPSLDMINARVEQLMASWGVVYDHWYATIAAQIQSAVNANTPEMLAALTVQAAGAAAILTEALEEQATEGAAQVEEEARDQGVDIDQATGDLSVLGAVASALAMVLAAETTLAAGREALRIYRPGADGETVARAVTGFLRQRSDVSLRAQLGGAVARAHNQGRMETMRAAPPATYYASEQLDKNTCGPCSKIDGKRLASLDAAMLAYGGSGGYIHCEGGVRCRGEVVAVWKR